MSRTAVLALLIVATVSGCSRGKKDGSEGKGPEARQSSASTEAKLVLGFEPEGSPAAAGSWAPLNDSEAGGASTARIAVEPIGPEAPFPRLRIDADVKRAQFPFPYAGALYAFRAEAGEDVSRYQRLHYRLRGTPGSYLVRIATKGVRDFNYHYVEARVGDQWQEHDPRLADFQQFSWGTTVPWTGTDVTAVWLSNFNQPGAPDASFAIEIADVYFH